MTRNERYQVGRQVLLIFALNAALLYAGAVGFSMRGAGSTVLSGTLMLCGAAGFLLQPWSLLTLGFAFTGRGSGFAAFFLTGFVTLFVYRHLHRAGWLTRPLAVLRLPQTRIAAAVTLGVCAALGVAQWSGYQVRSIPNSSCFSGMKASDIRVYKPLRWRGLLADDSETVFLCRAQVEPHDLQNNMKWAGLTLAPTPRQLPAAFRHQVPFWWQPHARPGNLLYTLANRRTRSGMFVYALYDPQTRTLYALERWSHSFSLTPPRDTTAP